MSKSPRFFLAAGLVVAIIALVLLFGRNPGPIPDAEGLLEASLTSGIVGPHSFQAGKTDPFEPAGNEWVLIRPFDVFSRKPLDLPELSLVTTTETVELARKSANSPAAYTVRMSLLQREGASWSYEVPSTTGPVRLTVPVAQRTPGRDGRLFLPYYGGVQGVVLETGTGAPLAKTKVQVFFLDPSNIEKLATELDQDPHSSRESLRSLPFLLNDYEDRFGQVKKVEAWTDAQGAFSLILPFSGPNTLHFHDKDHTGARDSVLVRPGQWTAITKSLRKRPLIHGTVRDSKGDPMPGVKVGIVGLLPYDSPDLSPLPQAGGFATYQVSSGSPGVHPVVGAKRTVRTDRLGRYSIRFPRGTRYAASAITDSGMDLVEQPVDDPESFGELVLDLQILPNPKPSSLHFQLENGRPLANARVTLAISDGKSWPRDFPELWTDEKGFLQIPWMKPGVRFFFLARSHQLTRPFPGTLGPESKLVTVPAEYLEIR